MSQAVGLQVLIMGAAALVEALAETGLECMEQRTFQTDDGKVHQVDLVVEDARAGAKVGVKIDAKTGVARFIAHDCKAGGVRGQALANRIVQRHAYHKAVGELRKKGYQVTKEETKADGSIFRRRPAVEVSVAEKLEIRLVIKPDGTVELTTHGLKGEECLAETKELEKAVGRVTNRTKTAEYHSTKAGTKTTVRRTT